MPFHNESEYDYDCLILMYTYKSQAFYMTDRCILLNENT